MRAAEGPSGSPISVVNSSLKCQRNAHRAGVLVAAILIGLASACGKEPSAPELPPGDWAYGDASRISAVLASLENLQGTPVARMANPLRQRLAGCQDFIAQATEGDTQALLSSARCVDPARVPASLVALRGESDLAFVFEVAPGRRLNGRLTRARSGAVEIDASLDAPESSSFAALLVPGDEPVGTIALSPADTLVHARLRPASGLKLAELVSQDSQADRMFRLRSELFLGQILDGTWEFAIYLPRAEQLTPPMALALDFTLRPAAKAAMKKLVSDLEATWPIHHSDQVIAGYPGACFYDLQLLPDLAPCWVLTEHSIVVGWNPLSIRVALSGTSGAGVADGAEVVEPFAENGELRVRLDRLSEADRRLQEMMGGRATGERIDYVWDELRLRGTSDGERVQLEVSLLMTGAS